MVHAHFAVMYPINANNKNLKSTFHCLLRHNNKAKIFASAGGAHPPPALSSSLQPNGCVIVIYIPGPPLFKIAGSSPVNT